MQNPHSSKEYTKSSCQIPFEPERAPIAANRTPVPFLRSLEDEAYIVVRNFVCTFPSWKDFTADTEQFPVFLRNLRVSNVLMLFMVILHMFLLTEDTRFHSFK